MAFGPAPGGTWNGPIPLLPQTSHALRDGVLGSAGLGVVWITILMGVFLTAFLGLILASIVVLASANEVLPHILRAF